MKKIIVLAVIILIGVSCQNQNSNKKGVTLRFSVWGTPEQIVVEKRIVRLFEEQNPGVKIEMIHIARDYPVRLLQMLSGNDLPDVFMIERSTFPQFAKKEALLELTEKVESPAFNKDGYYDLTWKAFSYKGKYYALPRDISGNVMYYNKTMLDKAGLKIPDNFEQFENSCAKLSVDLNHDKMLDQFGAIFPGFVPFLWGFGGDVFDNAFEPTKSTMDSKAALQSLEYTARMYLRKKVATPDVELDQGTHALFAAGKVGFYFSGKWMTPVLKDIKDFEWDAALPPTGPAGRFSQHGGTAIAASASTKYKDAAWAFLNFYAGEQAVAVAVKGGRTTPAIKSVANSPLFLEQRPPQNTSTFVWTMENGRHWCYAPDNIRFQERVATHSTSLANGIVTPQQMQADLHKELTELLAESEN